MYDFHYGQAQKIMENESEYLLFLKRLLPRWLNGIPDSEFLSIYSILDKKLKRVNNPIFVETGVGASTILLYYFASKYNGILFSWDSNASKGREVGSIINESICRSFNESLYKHWRFIGSSSLSKHLGINILAELGYTVDFCFLDSYHTLNNIISELKLIKECISNRSIVSIDDANYNNIDENYSFINIQRAKLGLSKVQEPKNNLGGMYKDMIGDYLSNNFFSVEKIEEYATMQKNNEIYFNYYSVDKGIQNDFGMEKLDNLGNRFAAWEVFKDRLV